MATKSIRVDDDILNELRLKSEGGAKTPNQVLRETFGLPEKKHRRSQLLKDHISKAERYLLKALEELKQGREEQ